MKANGGCSCGKIRYAVDGDPVLSVLCFCSDCLSAFGCDGYPGLMVADTAFNQTSGETNQYSRTSEAGRTVTRHFCATCGTNVWGQTELGLTSVVAGTLDDPNLFKPEKAVFTADAPAWARIPDHLTQE